MVACLKSTRFEFTRAQTRALILLKRQPDYHVLEYYDNYDLTMRECMCCLEDTDTPHRYPSTFKQYTS